MRQRPIVLPRSGSSARGVVELGGGGAGFAATAFGATGLLGAGLSFDASGAAAVARCGAAAGVADVAGLAGTVAAGLGAGVGVVFGAFGGPAVATFGTTTTGRAGVAGGVAGFVRFAPGGSWRFVSVIVGDRSAARGRARWRREGREEREERHRTSSGASLLPTYTGGSRLAWHSHAVAPPGPARPATWAMISAYA